MTVLRADRTDAAASTGSRAAASQLDGFLETLQPTRMGPRLAWALGGSPRSCHVVDAKYEPGVRAMVLYRREAELVTGDLLASDRADEPGLVVRPGLRLSVFPDDPGLPHLPGVMDRRVLGEALRETVARPSYDSLRGPTRCRTHLLRYRPGKRATLLAVPAGDGRRYVVKAYHDAGKAAAVATEAPALAAAASGSRRLAIAPLVAHVPELQVVIQREVAGTPLVVLLGRTRSEGATPAVAHAAWALAEFHGLGEATSRRRPVEEELHRFARRAAAVASVDPRSGDALGTLAERLLVLHRELPTAKPGLVHGDCTPGQFLVTDDRTYLMDLDHVGLSDQAVDVGTFLASLRQLDLRRTPGRVPRAARTTGPLAERFLAAYREVCPTLDLARVRWHEAAALERKALRAFARAPASPLPLALVAEAHRCLDRCERRGKRG